MNRHNEIIFRKATDQDSNAILDLIFDIWIKEYHFDVNREDFPDLYEIEKYYNKSDGLFLVAALDNTIVGSIACNKLNPTSYVLKRMFVKKEYRGLGIAQTLVDTLFKIIYSKKEINIKFYLSTKENLALAAKNFYLKNGFQITTRSQMPTNFPFFYKDDLFMFKNK